MAVDPKIIVRADLHPKIIPSEIVDDPFFLSRETRKKIIEHKETNAGLVKLSRTSTLALSINSTLFSIVFADNNTPFMLYHGKCHILGEGGQGRVKLAQNLITGEWVAVKIMALHRSGFESELENLELLGRLKGKAVRRDVNKGYIFQTLYNGIEPFVYFSEYALLHDANSLIEWLDMAIGATSGIQDFHRNNLIHRDIKCSNFIWLPDLKICVVIDVGYAKKLKDGVVKDQFPRGTQGYMAPETSEKDRNNLLSYTKRSDIYSLGVTFENSLKSAIEKINSTSSEFAPNIQYIKDIVNFVICPMKDSIKNRRPTLERCTRELGLIKEKMLQQAKMTKVEQKIRIEDVKINHQNFKIYELIDSGNIHALERFLKNGVDFSKIPLYNDQTPLCRAVLQGNRNIVQLLLKNKADPNAKNSQGLTALHLAARNGRIDLAEDLLKAGSDLSAYTVDNYNPLRSAGQFKQIKMFSFLIQHGAKPNAEDLKCALTFEVLENAFEIVKCGVEPSPEELCELLRLAIIRNSGVFIQYILKKDRNLINKFDKLEHTPLMTAVLSGHKALVQLLIQQKADIMIETKAGYNALSFAVSKNQISISRILSRIIQSDPSKSYSIHQDVIYATFFDGHHDAVKFLLELGVNINIIFPSGHTPLSIAVHKGHIEIIKTLLLYKADIHLNSPNLDLIAVALTKKHIDIAYLLLKSGAKILDEQRIIDLFIISAENNKIEIIDDLLKTHFDIITKHNVQLQTAMHYVIQHGYGDLLTFLLKVFCEKNIKLDYLLALKFAAQAGQLNSVRILLDLTDQKLDVNAAFSEEQTALFSGVQSNQLEMVQFLLERGADVNRIAPSGKTALHHAIDQNNLAMVHLLLSHKADPNLSLPRKKTALQYAFGKNFFDISYLLIKFGALTTQTMLFEILCRAVSVYSNLQNSIGEILEFQPTLVNLRNSEDWTALDIAIFNGNYDAYTLLLKYKADPKLINKYGTTPLHIAARAGQTKIAADLIALGANLDAQTEASKNSPLHYCVLNDQLEVAELLLRSGANPNIKASGNITPLHLAAKSGQIDFVELFIKCGANVNALSDDGYPLTFAASQNFILCMKILLEAKASVNLSNSAGKNALYIAVENFSSIGVELLLQFGADPSQKSLGKTPLEIPNIPTQITCQLQEAEARRIESRKPLTNRPVNAVKPDTSIPPKKERQSIHPELPSAKLAIRNIEPKKTKENMMLFSRKLDALSRNASTTAGFATASSTSATMTAPAKRPKATSTFSSTKPSSITSISHKRSVLPFD